jgi:DNA-binding GntR family transcriptional regulator
MQYMSYARNKQLMRIYSRLNTHLQIARLQQKFEHTSSQSTQAEHEAIIAALPGRDLSALQKAVVHHITQSKARTLAALS